MSSGGQILGGAIGAVAGFFLGGGPMGAVRGAYMGMTIGGIIDPPKGPTVTGPRLDDLSIQTSTYGANIPRVYGTVALNGNVFWLENNKLKEVVKKKKSGGKGGSKTTTKTFSYYATFALGLCEGPIIGVRRIWCGPDLIYDASSEDLGTIIASNETAGLFTLHNGAMDQSPDARMQATLGAANTPAYRGLAYIVFNDFPLEKHSNSLMAAQFKVEVVKAGEMLEYSSEIFESPPMVSGQWEDAVWTGFRHVAVSAVNNKIGVSEDGITWRTIDTVANPWCSVAWDGSILVAIASSGDIYATSKDGIVWTTRQIPIYIQGTSIRHNGNEFCIVGNWCSIFLKSVDGVNWQQYEMPETPQLFAMASGFGDFVAVGPNNAVVLIEKNKYTIATTPTSMDWSCVAFNGSVWCVLPTTAGYSMTSSNGLDWTLHTFPAGSFVCTAIVWDGNNFVAISTNYHLVGYSPDGINWIINDSGAGVEFSALVFNGGTICAISYAGTILRITPRHISQTLIALSEIVGSECLSSGLLEPSDVIASSLTQNVRGYRVSTVAAIRGAIEPLQAAWPFDVIQSGYKIVFKPRGGASVATIPASDLDARGSGDSPGVSITNAREMDSVLPRRVVVNYLDVTREYDTGTQADERLNTDSVNIRTIEMAIVLNATEALGIVQTLLYLYWLERYDLSFSLPSTYNHLEPGDSITVNSDEATYSLRLTGITYTQDGRLECTAKYDAPAIYARTAIGEEGTSTGQTITLAGATAFELLDIPLLLDSLDQPGFPVAMTGYLSGWPGGELFCSDDYGQTWDDIQGFGKPGAVIGTASNVIGATVTAMIDKSSTLSVFLINGELSSVSELAMLNGANYFAYGINGRWEIIAAQNCTLQGDGSYVLTDLLRGQQGTEWACGLHVVGDRVIALDASLAFVGASINSIGSQKTYRGVTLGNMLDSASDTPFTYTGVNLECLSPVYLNGSISAANDWTLTWIRRTRVGGAWRDYVDASLGEASEAYEVDIFSDGTYATLKRTISGLSSATCGYTSAQQISDFGLNVSTLYVKVYQLSQTVGRGYPLITSITR